MKFKVDKEACICCGACCAICEEVFEISDDDGVAVAKNIVITDEDVKQRAIDATEGCPTDAITKQ
ncbi:MAG: ferredoxin [Bacilli bacterium]